MQGVIVPRKTRYVKREVILDFRSRHDSFGRSGPVIGGGVFFFGDKAFAKNCACIYFELSPELHTRSVEWRPTGWIIGSVISRCEESSLPFLYSPMEKIQRAISHSICVSLPCFPRIRKQYREFSPMNTVYFSSTMSRK